MSLMFLSTHQLAGTLLVLLQTGSNMSEGGMMAMMVACVLFGLLLLVALVEFVILEFLWIKVWRQRLRNESHPAPSISSRAA